MNRDNQPAIEVEVVEIDGAAPPPPRDLGAMPAAGRSDDDDSPTGHPWTNWQRWPGQVRTLHPLWWPLLLVIGGIALALLLTVGLCLVVMLIIYRLIRGLLRALFE